MSQATINVGAVWAHLEAPSDQIAHVASVLRVETPGAEHVYAYKTGRWDGYTKFLRRPGNEFLSGLTWRVARALVDGGFTRPAIQWPEIDTRPPLAPKLQGITLRDYQVSAVERILRQRRLAVQCPTGGGKTEIGMEAVRRLGLPTLWVTHRRELLRQTVERFQERLPDVPIGKVGDGSFDPQFITVGLIQSLYGLIGEEPGWYKYFSVVVFDEAHHAGAETWQIVAQACSEAQYRIGFSGTMATGNPVSDMYIEGATGPTYTVASTMRLVSEGFLARPRIITLTPPPQSYPTYESVREEVCPDWRDNPLALKQLGGALFNCTYQHGIVNNDARNKLILQQAIRHVGAGEKVLILCQRIPHARALADALTQRLPAVWCLDGGAAASTRLSVLNAFKSAEVGAALVATPFFREGVDVPQIDVGILAGGGESDISVLQGLGRMLRRRPDKNEVLIYDFRDGRQGKGTRRLDKDYLGLHAQSRLGLYQEQGFLIEERE